MPRNDTHILSAIFRTKPHFIVSLLIATATFLILLPSEKALLSFIISWNAFSWVYLLFLFGKIVGSRKKDICQETINADESAKMVLFFLLIGCFVSLLVLFFVLGGHDALSTKDKIFQYSLTASTLISSWLLLPMGYTMHYAHLYYSNPNYREPWLYFPEKTLKPDYSDFMYFSFTIAVASQTADVEIASTPMRRAVLLQSIVSFIFNMAILGLCINISASFF